MSEWTKDDQQRMREEERERLRAQKERERAQREELRNQAQEIRDQAREHARLMREQAREIRDQAKQMADAQREIWREFGEELRNELHGIPRRKPQQPSLSLEQIVRAAMDIADREGSEAISMRRIAAELKAGAMSLYWHVANKDELLQQMIDEAYTEMDLPSRPTGNWRADIRQVASETRQIFLRHPWIAQLGPFARYQMGPGFLRHAEISFGAFEHTKISDELRADIVHVIDDYTIGYASREIAMGQIYGRSREEQNQWITRTSAIFERIAKSGVFPVLTRMFQDGPAQPTDQDSDRLFFFGLDCLLDGIAARIAAEEGEGFTPRVGGRFV